MTILIAEDDRATMLLELDYLKTLGEDVAIICVPDGAKACEVVERKKPDLVILDWHMPKMEGIEVLRFIKKTKNLNHIPVIMATSVSMSEGIERALSEGAIDYISKPIQKTELLSRVKAVMKIQRYSQEIEQQNSRLEQLNEKQQYFNKVIEKSNKKLEEVNHTKDTLFSIIAHDIKHPLAGTRFFSKMLLEDFDAFTMEELKEIITELDSSFDSTSDLLNNLLEWSSTQLEHINFEPSYFSLHQAISPNMKALEHTARIKNIDFQSFVNEQLMVYADANTVSLVVRNLLSNALKFTSENGKVSISATAENQIVKVVISDTGVGMSAAILDKLFSINHHITTRGTAGEKGTGLGLLLCQEFVLKNKGKIKVESEEKKGSTFTFLLPIAAK